MGLRFPCGLGGSLLGVDAVLDAGFLSPLLLRFVEAVLAAACVASARTTEAVSGCLLAPAAPKRRRGNVPLHSAAANFCLGDEFHMLVVDAQLVQAATPDAHAVRDWSVGEGVGELVCDPEALRVVESAVPLFGSCAGCPGDAWAAVE